MHLVQLHVLDLECAICMWDSNLGVYLEPCQISKVEFFAEIANG